MEPARVIKQVVRTVEEQEWLQSMSDVIEDNVVVGAYEKLGETQWPIRNILHGSFLGHPLHPVITDVPTGAWTTAFIFDVADALFKRRDLSAGADMAISVGLISGSIAAVTGLADWKHTKGRTQRMGLLHGLLNVGAAGFYTASLLARRSGARGFGQTLGTAGFGMMLLGAYLGGELVFDRLVGTNRAETPEGEQEFVPVTAIDELEEDTPYRFDVNDVPLVIVRSNGTVYALSNICAHLGRPLSNGEVHDGCITCPAHGSTYTLSNGTVVTGPTAFPQPTFDVRIREGQVEVCVPAT